jgi:hypothetical protein
MNTAPTPLKLEGVYDGSLCVTHYRRVYEEGPPGQLQSRGRLPVAGSGRQRLAYRLKTSYPWKVPVERVVGRFPTVNVWKTGSDTLVASALRWLFVSTDEGTTWRETLPLPASSGPMGVLPTAFCEHEGTCYVGEYPLDGSDVPRVHRSVDGGITWEPLLSAPSVRHVHAIGTDPYSGDLWMTTGDSGSECRIGRIVDGEFEVVGSDGQNWRAVEPVFTADGVLWGVDSVYTESNPIFLLPRGAVDLPDPEPQRLTAVDGSVYYGESLSVDGDEWVVFSTAYEAGADSTAPEDGGVNTGDATVVAASSATNYGRWHELAAYEKRAAVTDDTERGPTANAYVYLAADDRRGLFVNPYNTARHDGRLRNFRPDYFAALE